jgi:putative transposase
MYLWRVVDAEGEILDVLVQSKRDKHAALRLMRKLLKKQAMAQAILVTDRLGAYPAAVRELGLSSEHVRGKRKNNRAGIVRAIGLCQPFPSLTFSGSGTKQHYAWHRPSRARLTKATSGQEDYQIGLV